MSSDGLSQSEKVNLLFKNYMSFTTTSDSKEFFEETALANNTNIFSENILSKLPPSNPTYSTVSTVNDLESYLIYTGLTDISINNTWFTDKTSASGSSFGVNSTSDSDRSVLRLTKIKLDYLGSGSAAFICKDNNGENILQNLIPSNYAASGYSLSLHYNSGGTLKPVGWLATRTELAGAGFIGTSVDFGGALFDSKNGVVTFYDVNGDPATIFSSISSSFFLTATKYIGTTGLATQSSLQLAGTLGVSGATTLDSSLNVSGATTLDSSLDVSGVTNIGGNLNIGTNKFTIASDSGDTVIAGTLDVSGDSNLKGDLTVHGDLLVSGSRTYVNTSTLDVSDSLISLAHDNSGSGDLVDIGIYGGYNDGSSKYSGLFRDATDGNWKIFKDLESEPTSTIDITGTGYSVGKLIDRYKWKC
jgi:cytoskeletal protein CcmA (bactofilin family)